MPPRHKTSNSVKNRKVRRDKDVESRPFRRDSAKTISSKIAQVSGTSKVDKQKATDETKSNDSVMDFCHPFKKSYYSSFKIMLSARLCAAVWSNISDCDEVYNYWEPMHYLLHGTGFQTWEYSPAYAIRSYAYLWLYALPCKVYTAFLQSNKVLVFYFLRCLLGFCCAVCEVFFYRAICERFGNNVGRNTFWMMIFSTGMFISSTAFLPSTFSMYLSTVAMSAWFIQKYEVAVFCVALSTLVGWPFAAILGLPIAYDLIIVKKDPLKFLRLSIISLFLILVPLIFVDSRHFGRLVVAPLNIVMYNVFTPHGADLYGTEPFSFYFFNGILNFNIAFFIAIEALPLMFLMQRLEGKVCSRYAPTPPTLLALAPMYLWMGIFFPMAHKEERFLFPIYPLIIFSAGYSLDVIQKVYYKLYAKKNLCDYVHFTRWISIAFIAIFSLLSLSRTYVLYSGYRAPIEIFLKFSVEDHPTESPLTVCVGKEWYRFPSSFFLPQNFELKFVKSEFKGQLPKPFSDLPNATRMLPTDMNDQNLEEPSRYVDINSCDYLFDSDYPHYTDLEPKYHLDPTWNVTHSIPFLDTQRSHKFFRAFYIPFLSDKYVSYVDFHLLQRTNFTDRLNRKKTRTKPKY